MPFSRQAQILTGQGQVLQECTLDRPDDRSHHDRSIERVIGFLVEEAERKRRSDTDPVKP